MGKTNTTYTIPSDVTEIGHAAFCICNNLVSVEISESVEKINYSPFVRCLGLTNIIIPKTVSEIPYGIFYGCTNLTSVDILAESITIDWNAFYGCTSLTNVKILAKTGEIHEMAFFNCDTDKLTINGYADSIVETFANENNMKFNAIEDEVPKNYTVKFVDWNDTVLDTQEVEEGKSETEPTKPTREGYMFWGWYTEKEYINEYKWTSITKDTTLYAKWEKLLFTDINVNKRYMDSVTYVYKNNIMTGYDATNFAPDKIITRGQIATMLYRLAGKPDTTGLENPFKDVPAGKYYTEPVKWALSKGITTGKTATTFDPDGPITRQELAVFMARYSKEISGNDITSTYDISGIADYNDLSTWAKAPMQYIMEKGVITGDMKLGYARILPKNNATRAEAATMFTRFCQNIIGM